MDGLNTLAEILEAEITENFNKIGGKTLLETNYNLASAYYLYIKQILWLLMLLIAGFLSSTVISYFKDILSAAIALSFFIPVLIGSGGNTATQSSTWIIRAITGEDMTFRGWFRVVNKELLTGLILGSSFSAFSCYKDAPTAKKGPHRPDIGPFYLSHYHRQSHLSPLKAWDLSTDAA